jgi:acyl-CoA thioesterase
MDPFLLTREIPFIRDLGVEFISAQDGAAALALSPQPRHLNGWGAVHGGVLMSLLDVAMAVAGRSMFQGAGGGVTVEMKVSFVQPATGSSRLVAAARAFHRSKTMVFCEAELHDAEARLIAKALGTFKYLKADESTSVSCPEVRK